MSQGGTAEGPAGLRVAERWFTKSFRETDPEAVIFMLVGDTHEAGRKPIRKGTCRSS
jgi:hypothetical protein